MNHFKLFTILLNYLFLAQTPQFAQDSTLDQAHLIASKADSLIMQAVELEEHVGLSAGIFKDGKVLWTGARGWLDRENEVPANAKMVHRIASISKPMTAIAILQLFEQGKIDLDAPLQNYVPEFPPKAQGTLTVRQLLTHTSGIAHYKGTMDGFSLKEFPDLLSAMDRFKDRDLVGTPGEVYQYTTYGYVVLGVVIEKVSGMTYGEYMKKYVWEPAGMLHTSLERKKVSVENKSALYKLNDALKLKKDLNTDLSMKAPGGGIQSTAEDLLRFGQAILENKLIKPETRALMLKDPGIKEQGNPYAMGWFLYATEDEKRGRIIGHSGAQAGTSSQLMILLDKGVVISTLGNTRGSWGSIFRMSWQLIDLAVLEEARNKPLNKIVDLTPAEMDRFIGTYDFGNDQIMKITRKGDKLFSQVNKYPKNRLYPGAKNQIHYRDFDGYFTFEFDDRGAVTKTIYVQNGQEIIPKRIK